MKALLILAAALSIVSATAASAQALSLKTDVPGPPFAGARWAVAAPADTRWTLACRFAPITYQADRYDLHRWSNGLTREGRGSDQGRLPGPDGRCILTLTSGPGPIGVGLARKGATTVADGTNDPARPARASF
ncbi:MAG TPA: hypothetical protein VF633_10760 [Brevundimonas sp.]|jgi:hypothetical protein